MKPTYVAFSKVKEKNSAIHLMGLVSDGGVHSQLTHLFALIDMANHFDFRVVVSFYHPDI